MADDMQREKSLDDLLAEYNLISGQASELRKQMKVLARKIEDRAGATPLYTRSSHEIDITKLPSEPT